MGTLDRAQNAPDHPAASNPRFTALRLDAATNRLTGVWHPIMPDHLRKLSAVALALMPVEEGTMRPEQPHVMVYNRAMDLILAIAAHAQELAALPKGALELHWGPNGVTGRVHTQWEPTLTPDLYADLALQPPSAPPAPSPDSPRRGKKGRGGSARRPSVVDETPDREIIHGDEEPPWVMSTVR